LIRLHQLRGNDLEAERYLNQLARSGSLERRDARRLASLLAEQGNIDRAIEILRGSYSMDADETPADVLLGQLYLRKGDLDKANEVARKLLQEDPGVLDIEFAASLAAAQGDEAQAESILARLEQMDLEKGLREVLLAEHERNHGDQEKALQLYEDALEADGDNPAIWRRYLSFLLRSGDAEQMASRIAEAHEACPDDALLSTLNQNRQLIASTAAQPIAQPFLAAAVDEPERRAEALAVLKAIDEAPRDEHAQLATDLRRLSERYPRFLALKTQLTRLYTSLGRRAEAAQTASQIMREFPGSIDAARIAAQTNAAAGEWEQALSAAREWRERAPQPPMQAEMLIAGAQIQLGRPEEALKTLEPYVAQVRAEDGFSPILHLNARALIAAGRTEEAEAMLEPQLEASDRWRRAWMGLAGSAVPDEERAAQWLTKAADLVPEDAPAEREALASAWYTLADRSGQEAHLSQARQLLESLSEQPDASPSALLAHAMVAERQQDHAAAEASYRRALEKEPDLPAAKNNLAMMLATRGENLDEALRFAQEAVEAQPSDANYIDTLAQVHAARGDYNAAVEQMERAVELEPGNAQWQDRLSEYRTRQSPQVAASQG
jgi:tetratricopeptide (TPR) repeat protein